MKKILTFLSIIIFVFFLFSCEKKEDPNTQKLREINILISNVNEKLNNYTVDNFDKEGGLLFLYEKIKEEIKNYSKDQITDSFPKVLPIVDKINVLKTEKEVLQTNILIKLALDSINKSNITNYKYENTGLYWLVNKAQDKIKNIKKQDKLISIQPAIDKIKQLDIEYKNSEKYNQDYLVIKPIVDEIYLLIEKVSGIIKSSDVDNYLYKDALNDQVNNIDEKLKKIDEIFFPKIKNYNLYIEAKEKLNYLISLDKKEKNEIKLRNEFLELYDKRNKEFDKTYSDRQRKNSTTISKEEALKSDKITVSYDKEYEKKDDDFLYENGFDKTYKKVVLSNTVSDYSLFEDNMQSTFYPGALVKIKSNSDVNPITPINGVEQLQTTIFATIASANGLGDGKIAKTIPNPTASSVADSINSIISTNIVDKTNLASTTTAKVYKTNNYLELEAELGINLKILNFGANASVNANKKNSKVYYNVVIEQKYYSIIAEPKDNIKDYFVNKTYEEFLNYTKNGEVAGYVSSVTYGRIIILTVEIDKNDTNLSFDANIDFSSLAVKMKAYAKARKESGNTDLNISLFVYGGGSESTKFLKAYDSATQIDEVLKTLEDNKGGLKKVGSPIGYTVSYLGSKLPAKTAFERSYIKEIRTPKKIDFYKYEIKSDSKSYDLNNLKFEDLKELNNPKLVITTTNDYGLWSDDILKSFKYLNDFKDPNPNYTYIKKDPTTREYIFPLYIPSDITKIGFEFSFDKQYIKYDTVFMTFDFSKQIENMYNQNNQQIDEYIFNISVNDTLQIDVDKNPHKNKIEAVVSQDILNMKKFSLFNVPENIKKIRFILYDKNNKRYQNSNLSYALHVDINFSNRLTQGNLEVSTNNLILFNTYEIASSDISSIRNVVSDKAGPMLTYSNIHKLDNTNSHCMIYLVEFTKDLTGMYIY